MGKNKDREITENFLENINRQFEYNRYKNFFSSQYSENFRFTPETVSARKYIPEIDSEREEEILGYLIEKALQEFTLINQYYIFSNRAKDELKNIYSDLLLKMKDQTMPEETVAKRHYQNLRNWLYLTNSFSKNVYSEQGEVLSPVVCSEYSAQLQFRTLDMNPATVLEPILDIGCGTKGILVSYFVGKGFDATGIDRFTGDHQFLEKSDWFDYEFKENRWGTIISHLGFSNHFRHFYYLNDQKITNFSLKYREILCSLKLGGSFYYAPDLPFVEKSLNPKEYGIEKRMTGIGGFRSAKITRLK